MNSVTLLGLLGHATALMRRAKLGIVPRLGQRALRQIIQRDLRVEVDHMTISGGFDHWRYLEGIRLHQIEPYFGALFRASIKTGYVTLDVGSHLGYYALIAACAAGPRGKVYAFEPDPRNWKYLVKNVVLNGLDATIQPLQIAASDVEGPVLFHAHGTPVTSSLVDDTRAGVQLSVRAARIDDVIPSELPVNVVKMDIQGAEIKAFTGMPSVLERMPAGGVMFVECSPMLLKLAGSSAVELVGMLNERGFDVSIINEAAKTLTKIHDPASQIGSEVNLYCVKR